MGANNDGSGVQNDGGADVAVIPEGIAAEAVSTWLLEHVEGLRAPFKFTLIAGGHSNLTYRVDDAAGRALVLRRPPLGHVLESAHDMGREHKIISALQGTSVPVAKTFGLCRDTSVNEAPFYIMDYVSGDVLHDSPSSAHLSDQDKRTLGRHVIDVLCALHKTDVDAVGLGDLGRKEAYLARQLRRWSKQWLDSKTHEVPAMDAALALLEEKMPEQVGHAIVHGDYRLGNMLTANGKIKAVLDWELCTLGDPLADIGYLLNWWWEPGEIEEPGEGDQAPTAVGGFPSRDELCAWYEQGTGRDLSAINYYRGFSHWRLAAIGQGVYKRYLMGAMGTDHGFDLTRYKDSVTTRAQTALELLESL